MGTRVQSKAYMITWYGPFHNTEEVEEWEYKQNINFNLYLLQGKRKYAKAYSYYCGQTKRSVSIRFKDKNHCICQIPNQLNIWVGTFDNHFKLEDINIAENLLIYLLSSGIGDSQLLNERSLNFQSSNNVCLLNKWRNPNNYKQPENPIKAALPEIAIYNAENDVVKISKRLHYL